MSERYEKAHQYTLDQGCPAIAVEEVDVTVPVAVRAHADIGDVKIYCVGRCVITDKSCCAPGRFGSVSRFTIRQKMHIDIPIRYHCHAEIGEERVEYDLCDDPCCHDKDDDCIDHYPGNDECKDLHHEKDDDDCKHDRYDKDDDVRKRDQKDKDDRDYMPCRRNRYHCHKCGRRF